MLRHSFLYVRMKIGVLGFQGAIVEHQWHIEKLGHEAVNVRYPEQLEE